MNSREASPGSMMPSVGARALAGNEEPAARVGWFSGADLLISDTRLTLLLLEEARDRACALLFGVSKRDAGLVTIIGLGTLAGAANRKAHRVLKVIGLRRSDAWIGEGALNEGFYRIAGDASREVPLIGSLILGSVLLNMVLRVSFHDLRVAGRQLRIDFDHRYGHLLRPNRPRRPPTGM